MRVENPEAVVVRPIDDYVEEHVNHYAARVESVNLDARHLMEHIANEAAALTPVELQHFCECAGISEAYPLLCQLKEVIRGSLVP